MKPFNLKEYLANPDKKVITRDGRNAKIICTNFLSNKPIIAEIEKDGYSLSYDENGRNNNFSTPYDLFFAPEKREGWINIFRGTLTGCSIYKSEEEAKASASSNVIATVKIEWEEE